MSGAHIVISRELRARLNVLAAQEGTTVSKIVTEALEARAGKSPYRLNFPSDIRAKIDLWNRGNFRKDWKQLVREYIEPLNVEESFDVPDLMLTIGFTLERLPSPQDRIRVARVIRDYVETLPGIFPGPVDPRRPLLRQYYLSKDAAEMAYEEADVEAGRYKFEQCKDD